MKKILFLFLLSASTFHLFAQKYELEQAKKAYATYQVYFQSKDVVKQRETLEEAKTAIDKASVHKRTSKTAETWVYRGLIYTFMLLDTAHFLEKDQLFKQADLSYIQAKKLASKDEFTQQIDNININLSSYINGLALKCYKEKKYECALHNFEKVIKRLPTDSTMVFYAGVAANFSKKFELASKYYAQAHKMGMDSQELYSEWIKPHLELRDTVKALEILAAGRKKHPTYVNLLYDEINIYFAQNNVDELIKNLDFAIKEDPDNHILYYLSGYCNEVLEKKEIAEVYYKKSVDIKPNYFEGNYALGKLIVASANKLILQANSLPLDEQQKYERLKEKFSSSLNTALPYLEKAFQLKATQSIYNTLLSIYTTLKLTEKLTDLKKLEDKLIAE